MSSAPPLRPASSRALGLLVPVVVLAILAWRLPPDGKENSELAHFLGRFHPVALHLPIGMLALVPLLAILGSLPRLAHLRAALPFVLWTTTLAAIVAATLGYLLAWGGEYEGELLERHLWGSIGFCAFLALTTWAVGRGVLFVLFLLLSLGSVGLAAHDGGSLTHGEGFLTAKMPASLRSWLGLEVATKTEPPRPDSRPATESRKASEPATGPGPSVTAPSHAAILGPIFEKKCVSCHKPSKKKGELLMTSYDALLEGGETGPAVVPGDLEKSELWRRITLPSDHDEFMPSDGKPPLTKEEVELVRAWIVAGAPKG